MATNRQYALAHLSHEKYNKDCPTAEAGPPEWETGNCYTKAQISCPLTFTSICLQFLCNIKQAVGSIMCEELL
jgi:hypothetical protein